MDCLSAQRDAMQQWLSDAEAAQHRLAKQQLDLEERQRQLDHFEKVVRQRERDVLQAEAAASSAKRAEIAIVKKATTGPLEPAKITYETIFNDLMEGRFVVVIVPEQPYSPELQLIIKRQGLKLTTHVPPGSRGRSILRFGRIHSDKSVKVYKITMAMPSMAVVIPKAVELILTPVDASLTDFRITSVKIGC